jgi:hypothetical protein
MSTEMTLNLPEYQSLECFPQLWFNVRPLLAFVFIFEYSPENLREIHIKHCFDTYCLSSR